MNLRLLASSFLLLLFLFSAGWLLSQDWEKRLSTDVMELIPDRSPSPELALGRSVLSDVYANRVMIALREVSDPRSLDVYRAHLEASPLVGKVINLSDVNLFAEVGQYVFQYRFDLLFPQWLVRHSVPEPRDALSLAERVSELLDAALNDPGFLTFEDLVPSDPLLLMREAADELQAAQPSQAVDPSTTLFEVTLSVSALAPEGQGPVFDLLDEARLSAAEYSPGIRVLDTGAHRYAAETERHMRNEVRHLNFSTAVVVFLICALFCRRWTLVIHVFLILLISLLAGLALMICFFDQVHVFSLIFGCVLCGVIVDYALHAYLHDAGSAKRSLRSFLKPFLISCGSTLMGFSILLLSDLPVLRQMGLLVVCGLAMAVIVALVYVFAVLGVAPEAPAFSRKLKYPRLKLRGILLFGACVIGLLPFVRWEDDIRYLKYPLPHLDAVDAEIRNLHGGERRVLLTVGESYSDSRESLEALNGWLTRRGAGPGRRLNAAAWVPGYDAYLAACEFAENSPEFAQTVLTRLVVDAYDGEVFAPFVQDWIAFTKRVSSSAAEADYEAKVQAFSEALEGGLSGMVGSHDSLYWWVTLVDASVELPTLPSELNTLEFSQVESMSSVLSRYRERTLELSLIGGIVMYLVLMLGFGIKNGSRILFVPALSVLSAVVVIYGATGALGIFHLIGLFLGACLVLDYAVFTWMGFVRWDEMPFSVIVSALTTIASFFVLCWSRIPAIHSLGLAVFWVTLLGILSTYLFIPQVASAQEKKDAS